MMQCRGSGEVVQPDDTTVACRKTRTSWQETDETGHSLEQLRYLKISSRKYCQSMLPSLKQAVIV